MEKEKKQRERKCSLGEEAKNATGFFSLS